MDIYRYDLGGCNAAINSEKLIMAMLRTMNEIERDRRAEAIMEAMYEFERKSWVKPRVSPACKQTFELTAAGKKAGRIFVMGQR